MNKTLSEKIRVCGLYCAFIVVLRHSLNLQAFFGMPYPDNWCAELELFFSKLTEMAVPYFFMISGFFFLGKSYYNVDSYFTMIKRKFYTLFIPYILWIIIGNLITIPVGLSRLPSNLHTIGLVFWEAQGAGVLWYIRTLILLMVLYPFYGWIYTVDKIWLYIICLILTFVLWIPVDMRPLSTEGIFFFLLGGIIKRYDLLGKTCDKHNAIIILLFAWIISAYLSNNIFLNKITILLGISTVWLSIDWFSHAFLAFSNKYSSLSFFLYVAHIYVLKGLKHLVASFCHGNQLVAFISFFVLAILATIIVIKIAELLKTITPKFYLLLTGGRS